MRVRERAPDTFEAEAKSPADEACAKSEHTLSALRAELEPLKMSQIKLRVAAGGVSTDAQAFHDAEDNKNPKAALIQLLLDAERCRLDAAAAEEADHAANVDAFGGAASGLFGRAKPIDSSLPLEGDKEEKRHAAGDLWLPRSPTASLRNHQLRLQELVDHADDDDDDIGGFEGPRRFAVAARGGVQASVKLGDTDTRLVFVSQKSRHRIKCMKMGSAAFCVLVAVFWVAFMISHSATHGDNTQQYRGEMKASSVEEIWHTTRNPPDEPDNETVVTVAPEPWPDIEVEPESNVPVYMQLSVNAEFPANAAEMEVFKAEFVTGLCSPGSRVFLTPVSICLPPFI